MKALVDQLKWVGVGKPSAVREWSAESWLTPGRFAALLGLFMLAAYPEVVVGSHSFYYRDFGLFQYQLAHYTRASFWSGEWPLWNPLNNCGLPFLAQWNSMVCYPLSLIYLLLPLPWSLNYFCLLHLFLAGLTMYGLAYHWTGSRWAAGVAGLAYALNGLTLQSLMWSNNIAALAWMPLVLLCVERAWREGGRRILWAAAVSATQVLAGAPEIIAFTWLGAVALWLGQRAGNLWSGAAGRKVLAAETVRFGSVLFLVAGLTAVQLFPFVDLLWHSHRDRQYEAGAWAMPGWGWANLFVPLFHCTPSLAGVYSQDEQQWTSSYYLGVGVLGLAILAGWQCREKRVKILTGLAGFGLVMALGQNGYLYSWLKAVFPVLGYGRFPVKFVVLAVVSVPLLAAHGLARWECVLSQGRPSGARPLVLAWGGLLVVIAGLLWFARWYPYPGEQWAVTWWSGLSRAGFLTGIVCAVWGWGRGPRPMVRMLSGLILLVLVGVDGLSHTPRQNPTVANWVYARDLGHGAPRPVLGVSRAMISPRVKAYLDYAGNPDSAAYCLGHRRILLPNWNVMENAPLVDGFYSLYVREHREVTSLLSRPGLKPPGPLLDFLGVTQVTSDEELFAWVKRDTALPLISAGQKPVFGDASERLAEMAGTGFAPDKMVYLPREAAGEVQARGGARVEVVPRLVRAQAIEFEVRAEEPVVCTVAQTYYHWWRAYVDGRPTQLWRANHAFQALAVPAGQHGVRLVYEDGSWRAGAAISVLTLLGWMLLVWRWPTGAAEAAAACPSTEPRA